MCCCSIFLFLMSTHTSFNKYYLQFVINLVSRVLCSVTVGGAVSGLPPSANPEGDGFLAAHEHVYQISLKC